MERTYSIIILLFFGSLLNCKLVCNTNDVCTSNLTPKYFCNKEIGFCEHEPLNVMPTPYIIGIVIIMFISAFANAGGIGGGSVIVPVLTIMFLFEVNEAIPMSKATIFAGAVINVVFLLNQRKENDFNKFLIDYKLCSFMLPIMMCGTFFGVYLNFIIPPMIVIMLLTFYLGLSMINLYKKYKIISAKEDKELGKTLSEQISSKFNSLFKKPKRVSVDKFLNSKSNTNSNTDSLEDENSIDSTNSKDNLESDQAEEFEKNELCLTTDSEVIDEHIQLSFFQLLNKNIFYIITLVCTLLMIIGLSLFKEGVLFKNSHKIEKCSTLGIFFMIFIAIFCITISAMTFLVNIKSEKKKLKEEFKILNEKQKEEHIESFKQNTQQVFAVDNISSSFSLIDTECEIESKIKIKKQMMIKLGGVSFVAGIGSGLLGIGGGMIINPFLIMLNYSPMDASAISSLGVLFTSTISTSEFLILGAIKLDDLNYFLFFSGLGSLIGVFIIKELIVRFQRHSILLMIILFIFVIAVIVLPTFEILTIPVENYFKFGSLCNQ